MNARMRCDHLQRSISRGSESSTSSLSSQRRSWFCMRKPGIVGLRSSRSIVDAKIYRCHSCYCLRWRMLLQSVSIVSCLATFGLTHLIQCYCIWFSPCSSGWNAVLLLQFVAIILFTLRSCFSVIPESWLKQTNFINATPPGSANGTLKRFEDMLMGRL